MLPLLVALAAVSPIDPDEPPVIPGEAYWPATSVKDCERHLYEDGFEVDEPPRIPVREGLNAGTDLADSDGHTLLHMASHRGQMATVRFLLLNGADVNNPTKADDTPLTLAAAAGQTSVVQFLLDHDAKVDAQDYHGQHALLRAAHHGQTQVALAILAHAVREPRRGGLRKDVTSLAQLLLLQEKNEGNTALHVACHLGRGTIVGALVLAHQIAAPLLDPQAKFTPQLKRVAPENPLSRVNKHGHTPLHMAIRHPHLIQMLIEGGAKVGLEDHQGMLPHEIAIGLIPEVEGDDEIEDLLETTRLLLHHSKASDEERRTKPGNREDGLPATVEGWVTWAESEKHVRLARYLAEDQEVDGRMRKLLTRWLEYVEEELIVEAQTGELAAGRVKDEV